MSNLQHKYNFNLFLTKKLTYWLLTKINSLLLQHLTPKNLKFTGIGGLFVLLWGLGLEILHFNYSVMVVLSLRRHSPAGDSTFKKSLNISKVEGWDDTTPRSK